MSTSRPAGSVVRRLQIGFFVSAALLAGLVAAVIEWSLLDTLDQEDRLLIDGVAGELAARRSLGQLEPNERSLQVVPLAWCVLGADGQVRLRSPSFAELDDLPWPAPAQGPVELDRGDRVWLARTVSLPRSHERLLVALDRSVEMQLMWRHRMIVLAAVVFGAAAALWIGRALAQAGLRPLRRIAEAAAEIGPGDAAMRLDSSEFPSELQEVVGRLNAALERLHRSAMALDAAASDIAHELRTPLNLLRLRLENLGLQQPLPPDAAGALGAALEDIDAMAQILEHLLFLARIEHGRGEARPVAVDAGSELRKVGQFFAAAAEEADVTLDVTAADVTIQADPALLQRALHNLTANALRYAPAGSTVSLSVQRDGDTAVLAVDDAGPGLPQAVLERLGERFVRSEPSRERATGGSGLGLAIAARVAEVHQGRLSARVGPGGHVELRLPVAGPQPGW